MTVKIPAKPNFTAWFVLQGCLVAMQRCGFSDEHSMQFVHCAKPLATAAAKTRPLSALIAVLPYSLQYKIGEFVSSTGRLLHFCLRKRQVADWLTQALREENIAQVVVLGAGLDVQAHIFAKQFPQVRFIEVDVEDTLAFKRSVLNYPADNLDYVYGDLRNPLAEILAASRFDKTQKTLWIAEGLLMFIPHDSVTRIFSEIRSLSVAGSQMIFTSLPVSHVGSPVSIAIQKLCLGKEKSPILWAMPSESMAEFVDKMGFSHMQWISYDELHKSHKNENYQVNKQVGEDMHRAKVVE